MSEDSRGRHDDGKLLYCSFCGKSQHEVRKLIAGPSVFVCDECVELCNDIIREELEDQVVDWLLERARVTERPRSFSELTGFGRSAPEHEHNHDHGHDHAHAPTERHEQQEAGST